jgi:hypothetical protein
MPNIMANNVCRRLGFLQNGLSTALRVQLPKRTGLVWLSLADYEHGPVRLLLVVCMYTWAAIMLFSMRFDQLLNEDNCSVTMLDKSVHALYIWPTLYIHRAPSQLCTKGDRKLELISNSQHLVMGWVIVPRLYVKQLTSKRNRPVHVIYVYCIPR